VLRGDVPFTVIEGAVLNFTICAHNHCGRQVKIGVYAGGLLLLRGEVCSTGGEQFSVFLNHALSTVAGDIVDVGDGTYAVSLECVSYI